MNVNKSHKQQAGKSDGLWTQLKYSNFFANVTQKDNMIPRFEFCTFLLIRHYDTSVLTMFFTHIFIYYVVAFAGLLFYILVFLWIYIISTTSHKPTCAFFSAVFPLYAWNFFFGVLNHQILVFRLYFLFLVFLLYQCHHWLQNKRDYLSLRTVSLGVLPLLIFFYALLI